MRVRDKIVEAVFEGIHSTVSEAVAAELFVEVNGAVYWTVRGRIYEQVERPIRAALRREVSDASE